MSVQLWKLARRNYNVGTAGIYVHYEEAVCTYATRKKSSYSIDHFGIEQ